MSPFELAQPTPGFLIEPAATGAMVSAFRGGWELVGTGDQEFDRVFRVSSPDAEWVRTTLSSSIRQQMLALHAGAGGPMQPGAAASMSKALLVGSFEGIDSVVS